ncbi:MAG: dimethylamine monooxygenase subunit DmmA family protein [Granulosicoccus sp.]
MSTLQYAAFKSRPFYGTLKPVSAVAHLVVAEGEGAVAVQDLVAAAPADFLASATLVYAEGSGGQKNTDDLRKLGFARFHGSATAHAALPRVQGALDRLRMGTQIYLSGSETALSLFVKACADAGQDYQGLQTEHRGSLARRMQCVHCKGITEDVTTQPAQCAHCGLLLLVRDHYSRRIGAFQGVNINAEDPSDVPEKEEAFR